VKKALIRANANGPDGKSIVFSYGPSGSEESFYRQNADGTGSKEKLLETPGIRAIPFSVSPDGRYIAYMRNDRKSNTGWDIWALPMFPDKAGDQKPFPVVATNFIEVTPSFSPDGKWLAYANNETGRMEVYIQPFPSGAGRWQVSTAGGVTPNWRKDGKELFFFSTDGQIMAVDVSQNGASLQLGAPHALFKAATVSGATGALQRFRRWQEIRDEYRFAAIHHRTAHPDHQLARGPETISLAAGTRLGVKALHPQWSGSAEVYLCCAIAPR
jgi:dipeptidyl aminopeptidase/acylaminoacyl peptidase